MKIVAMDSDNNIVAEYSLGDGMDSTRAQVGMLAEIRVWQYLDSVSIKSRIVSLCSPAIKGVDILLANGITVEVKAARKSHNTKGTENFAFGARKTLADFIVVWAVDYDDFYIIPRSFTNPGVNRIYPNAARWQYVRNNWSLLVGS